MDKQSIVDRSKGSELDTTMTFKINSEVKEALVVFCSEHGLSVGKVIRNLIGEFLDA